MAVLSDKDIFASLDSGRIKFESADGRDCRQDVHAASVDLRLGRFFKIYDHSKIAILNPKDKDATTKTMRTIEIQGEEPFIIQPGEFVLGVTQEIVTFSTDLMARLEGRSSIGRLGIVIHATAGLVNPGWSGSLTLEISNINRMPIALYPGMHICQISFEEMSTPVLESYADKKTSKYQNQVLPEGSRITEDPTFKK